MLYTSKEPVSAGTACDVPSPTQQGQWAGGLTAQAPERQQSAVELAFQELDVKIKYLADTVATLQKRLSPIIVVIPRDPMNSNRKEVTRPQSAISQRIIEAGIQVEIEINKLQDILSSLTI